MPDGYTPEPIAQSPSVVMFTAPNPGPMTLQGTHTYVVGHDMAYVIDPGPDIPEYIDALRTWLQDSRHHVEGILLTHGHPDHTPGAASLTRLLGDVPVWASVKTAAEPAREAGVGRRFAPDQQFDVGGDTLAVLQTPGHTRDHVAFWLPELRLLIAGDTILGEGSSVIAPPEGDMAAYMRTLAQIQALDPAIIAPGHGPIITDPGAKVAEYVEHRKQREQQILDVLAHGPAGIDDLVDHMYVDTDPRLLDFARRSVEAQIIKLESEGLVRHRGDRYELC